MFVLSAASVMAGGVWFALALGIVAILGGEEYTAILRAKGIHPSHRIIRAMIFAFFVLAALPGIKALNLPWDTAITHFPILLTIGVCSSFFRLLFRNETPPATIADISTTIMGFIYLGFLPCHLVLLRNLQMPGIALPENPLLQPGLAYVWASLFMIWATDTFAYYFGKKFGKTPLYPQVSPKKTVEGAVGGFIMAQLFGLTVVYFADILFPCHPFKFQLWQAPIMGAILSISAQIGDLCESLLKRDAGMKDSSALIPGHGGMLDRGDSLIFAGAIAYYWVCIVVLGIL